MSQVDVDELRTMVRQVYKYVAEYPHRAYHFEMGRQLALQLGYRGELLDRVPHEALESFAGVGHHLDFAAISPGELVVDLGSGSGTDSFLAALEATPIGDVIGIDMTEAQHEKARRLAIAAGFSNIRFELGYLEELPIESQSVDVAISNGVFNLCPDKACVFREIARVLKQGGRMAISDIATERQLADTIVCDANLWASCIGGALQEDHYIKVIEDAGLSVRELRDNPQYRFVSDSAQAATTTFGVKSISLMAVKA